MNTTTNSNSSFSKLTWNTKFFISGAQDTLTDPKRGVIAAANNPRLDYIANDLMWNAEGWMLASHKIAWAGWALKEMEEACWDAVACGACREEDGQIVFDEAYFDAKADKIKRRIASEAMGKVFRGVESSSNPMKILNSKAEIDAARSAMEAICGLGAYNVVGFDNINDVFDGNARRKAAEEVELAKKVVLVTYMKKERCDGGGYMAHAFNYKDVLLDSKHFIGVTQKGAAKECAYAWAEELERDVNGDINGDINSTVRVETQA